MAQSTAGLRRAVGRFQQRTAPPEVVEKAKDDGLEFTGQLAGGLWRDVRRRWPWYARDFQDGLTFKCLAATVFLFFACLAPAITFGGFMAAKTGGDIGAVEMIVASAVCGMAYALLGGQPLIILGGTGPMLIFHRDSVRPVPELQIPFLPTYAWVGLWSAGILLILAVTDASCWMRVFTRFTDEIFAALISIIFIFEAVKAMVEIFEGLEAKRHHDTALLSLLLALGTFYIASTLSRMRRVDTSVRLPANSCPTSDPLSRLARWPPVRSGCTKSTWNYCRHPIICRRLRAEPGESTLFSAPVGCVGPPADRPSW